MGRLTRDPEVRYASSGSAVAKLGVAVNRFWRNQDGQQQEEVSFIEVTAFGKQAETMGQYMKKGNPIFVEGHLRQDSWEDKETGKKRSKLGVVLDRFEFIDSAGGGNSGGGAAPVAEGGDAPASGGGGFTEDDDVPF